MALRPGQQPERSSTKRTVKDQSGAGKLKIGELLSKAGYITATQFEEAKAVQKKTGLTNADREYQAAASEVTSLKVALATAKGRPAEQQSTAPIEEALKAAQKRVDEITEAQAEFTAPEYAVDNARAALADRTAAVSDIRARQAASITESIETDVTQLPWRTEFLRRAVSAALIGLALAVLLLAIPEVLRRSRDGSDDELIARQG